MYGLNYDQEQIYKDFRNFYDDNYGNINKSKMSVFFQTHSNYSTTELINLCNNKKIYFIHTMLKPKNSTSIKSSGNLAIDIIAGILLAPWYLIFSIAERTNKDSEQQQKIALEEIDKLTTIIRKLNSIISE